MSQVFQEHPYFLADVFTDRRFGGNPLAVFPYGDRIPAGDMPRIAAELNLSETSFVLPPSSPLATHRLRIFTPRMELPFAGHPTVGTACVLAHEGHVDLIDGRVRVVFEEGVGNVPVEVELGASGYSARFAIAQMPQAGPAPPSVESIAEMLGVTPDNIAEGDAAPRAVSCGVPYLFVEVLSSDVLARVRMNVPVWERVLKDYWAPHVYVIARLSDCVVRARMFAPAMGIVEDPATGAAASALAGFVDRSTFSDGHAYWKIEQGIEMGRPSLIEVMVHRREGRIQAIDVGGQSVLMGRGFLLEGV